MSTLEAQRDKLFVSPTILTFESGQNGVSDKGIPSMESEGRHKFIAEINGQLSHSQTSDGEREIP